MITMKNNPKPRRKTKSGASGGKKNPNSRRNIILISISLGIIAGIPIGMLLQPIFLSILPTEVNEAELTITLSRDCKIILNDTTEGGLGKRTFDYEEYASENISSTLGITYGHFDNPDIVPDLIELADGKNTANEVKKELKSRGWREEDSDFYATKYPRAMTIYQGGILNLLSEDFVFPYIDIEEAPPEPYYPPGTLIEDDLELSKNDYFVIDYLVMYMEIDYDVSGGLIEDEYVETFVFFLLEAPLGLFTGDIEETNPLDVVSLREKAFIEVGQKRDIVIEELFFNINQYDEIELFTIDISIDGKDTQTLGVISS